jgi:hypothetical protein
VAPAPVALWAEKIVLEETPLTSAGGHLYSSRFKLKTEKPVHPFFSIQEFYW